MSPGDVSRSGPRQVPIGSFLSRWRAWARISVRRGWKPLCRFWSRFKIHDMS